MTEITRKPRWGRLNGFAQRLGDYLRQVTGWRRAAICFFAGVGATLAMAPYYILPLLVVGYSALFAMLSAIDPASGDKPLRRAFMVGWWFGFGYFVTGIYWMGFAFLVRAEEFAWMVPIAIPGFAAFLALFFALPALLFVFVRKRMDLSRTLAPIAGVLLLVGLISLFEYLRGHILTGLPWNLTGQALLGLVASAQSAAIYGVYGLGLVVLVLAMLPALDLMKPVTTRANKTPMTAWSLVGFLILFGGGVLRLSFAQTTYIDNAELIIVQPNISQKDKMNPALAGANFEALMQLSETANIASGTINARYMIWPENAVSWIDEQPFVLDAISARIDDTITLITGSIRRDESPSGQDRYYNTIGILESGPANRSVNRFYDKHHLVPFGEYLPMKNLLKAIGLAQLAPVEDGFTPGVGPQTLTLGPLKIAPLVCYEAIFPGALYPRGQRPDLMVTSTNDAWFGDNAGPKQHLDQARLRSIETGIPMARSANTGISSLIDGYGRVIEQVPLYQTGVIRTGVPRAATRTLYDIVGDAVWMAMLMLVFAIATYYGRRRA